MFTLRIKAIQSQVKNKEGKKQWYPRLIRRGTATTEDLAEIIAKETLAAKADVHSIIRSMESALKQLLMDGRSVKLEGLGTLNVILSSRFGVDTSEEVSAKQIRKLRIRFIPEGKRTPMDGLTRTMFSGVRFERYDPKTGEIVDDNSGNEDDGDYVDPTA